jgi:hypothetical protein
MKFERLYGDYDKSIYFVTGSHKLLKDKYYLISTVMVDGVKKIYRYSSNTFPMDLFLQRGGYLFTKVKADKKHLKKLISIEKTPQKTVFVNLTDFFKPNYNGYMILERDVNCNPRFNTSIEIPMKFNCRTTIDKNYLLHQLRKIQRPVKSAVDWFEDICAHGDYSLYPTTITDESFKKPITYDDIIVLYDIHDKNEIDYVKIIERTFEDLNQKVKIYRTYDGLYDAIVGKKLKTEKITDEYLTIKFSELLKLKLEFTIGSFM